MLASLFLIGASLATPQMSVQAASQTIVEDGADGMATAVNRMVGGIVGYARWPDEPAAQVRTLCLVGTPRLADRIAPVVAGGPAVRVRYHVASSAHDDCDILFLGRMADADRRKIIAGVRNHPTITITDDDPACLYGAMFCLRARAGGLSFSANLDAVARGTVRIDPRVLKLGGAGGEP